MFGNDDKRYARHLQFHTLSILGEKFKTFMEIKFIKKKICVVGGPKDTKSENQYLRLWV